MRLKEVTVWCFCAKLFQISTSAYSLENSLKNYWLWQLCYAEMWKCPRENYSSSKLGKTSRKLLNFCCWFVPLNNSTFASKGNLKLFLPHYNVLFGTYKLSLLSKPTKMLVRLLNWNYKCKEIEYFQTQIKDLCKNIKGLIVFIFMRR